MKNIIRLFFVAVCAILPLGCEQQPSPTPTTINDIDNPIVHDEQYPEPRILGTRNCPEEENKETIVVTITHQENRGVAYLEAYVHDYPASFGSNPCCYDADERAYTCVIRKAPTPAGATTIDTSLDLVYEHPVPYHHRVMVMSTVTPIPDYFEHHQPRCLNWHL